MKEALKLALETLESSRVFVMSREMIKQPEGADWYDNRITAIKEVLAQPEQEPWLLETTQALAKALAREFYPEVTQWECLDDLAGVISQIDNMTTGLMRKPVQPDERNFCPRCGKRAADIHTCTPPQSQWVGLTDAEMESTCAETWSYDPHVIARAIEAKLKEKNK